MADKSITVANVLASAGAAKFTGTAGAGVTITAGQNLFKAADGTLGLLDGNAVAGPTNVFEGVALHATLPGQPIVYVKTDPNLQPGYTVAAGECIIASGTPGASAPFADATTGFFVTILGVGIGGNKINLTPLAAGVAE